MSFLLFYHCLTFGTHAAALWEQIKIIIMYVLFNFAENPPNVQGLNTYK